MKLSCAWDETPLLQTTNDADMSNSLHIRNRLLDAITQMQSAVGLRDIGRLHYQPIVDQSNGVQFLVTVAYVGDMRSVQVDCCCCLLYSNLALRDSPLNGFRSANYCRKENWVQTRMAQMELSSAMQWICCSIGYYRFSTFMNHRIFHSIAVSICVIWRCIRVWTKSALLHPKICHPFYRSFVYDRIRMCPSKYFGKLLFRHINHQFGYCNTKIIINIYYR
jgi:hypothetical protein